MVFSHPPGGKRKQREPEQEMQVGPEHCTCHHRAGMQQVMVIIPVNANVQKAQNVAEKHGQQRSQCSEAVAMRHLHLQYHDRDNDRDHAIAERLQPSFGHLFPLDKI